MRCKPALGLRSGFAQVVDAELFPKGNPAWGASRIPSSEAWGFLCLKVLELWQIISILLQHLVDHGLDLGQ
jgi:hypothetical protein